MSENEKAEPVEEIWVYAGARTKAGLTDDILDAWIEPGGKELYYKAERRSPAVGGTYRIKVLRTMEGDRERVSRFGDPRWDGTAPPHGHDRAQINLWRAEDQQARGRKAARQAEERLKREKPDWLTGDAQAALAKCRTADEVEAVIFSIRRACWAVFTKGRS